MPAQRLGLVGRLGPAGLVAIGSGPLTWTRHNLWFARQRGLALGMALIGTSFTGIAVPQLAGLAIDHLGWRSAFPLLALLPLCSRCRSSGCCSACRARSSGPRWPPAAAALTGLHAGRGAARRPLLADARVVLLIASATALFMHLQQILELKLRHGHRRAASSLPAAAIPAVLRHRLPARPLLGALVALPILILPALASCCSRGGAVTLPLAYVSAQVGGPRGGRRERPDRISRRRALSA